MVYQTKRNWSWSFYKYYKPRSFHASSHLLNCFHCLCSLIQKQWLPLLSPLFFFLRLCSFCRLWQRLQHVVTVSFILGQLTIQILMNKEQTVRKTDAVTLYLKAKHVFLQCVFMNCRGCMWVWFIRSNDKWWRCISRI